jgi:hypothetical protein
MEFYKGVRACETKGTVELESNEAATGIIQRFPSLEQIGIMAQRGVKAVLLDVGTLGVTGLEQQRLGVQITVADVRQRSERFREEFLE